MKENKVIELNTPEETGNDVLTEMIKQGIRKILEEALEIQIETFIDQYRELRTSQGQRRFIRDSHLPERRIVTGVGEFFVKVPRWMTILN